MAKEGTIIQFPACGGVSLGAVAFKINNHMRVQLYDMNKMIVYRVWEYNFSVEDLFSLREDFRKSYPHVEMVNGFQIVNHEIISGEPIEDQYFEVLQPME